MESTATVQLDKSTEGGYAALNLTINDREGEDREQGEREERENRR